MGYGAALHQEGVPKLDFPSQDWEECPLYGWWIHVVEPIGEIQKEGHGDAMKTIKAKEKSNTMKTAMKGKNTMKAKKAKVTNKAK